MLHASPNIVYHPLTWRERGGLLQAMSLSLTVDLRDLVLDHHKPGLTLLLGDPPSTRTVDPAMSSVTATRIT